MIDDISDGQEKTINGSSAYYYETDARGMQYRKYVVSNGKKVVVLTYLLKDGSSDDAPAKDYSKYASDVAAIANSLQFVE